MLRDFSEIDLKHLKNIKTALLKGRFELSGVEAIEIAKMVQWIQDFHTSVEADIAQKAESRMIEQILPKEPEKSKTQKGKKK